MLIEYIISKNTEFQEEGITYQLINKKEVEAKIAEKKAAVKK